MEPTIERRALNALLVMFPDFDLLGVDWQRPADYLAHRQGSGSIGDLGEPGPWLLVYLGQRSDDGFEAWARHDYAIWKRTGAVHLVGADGAVIDPPLITL